MCDYNELFKENGVSIDHSKQVRDSIEQNNKEIYEAMIITLDENNHAIDLQKIGDRYGEDIFIDLTCYSEKKTNNSLLTTEACVVKGFEYYNYGKQYFQNRYMIL